MDRVSQALSAFFLVCLSFLSLSVTAYSLSVYQLRARMQSYTVGKQPLSMYQLKRFADLTRVESNSVEVQEKLFLQKQMLMEKMSPLVLEITELGLSYRNEEVPVITALRVGGILPEVLPEVADGKDETFRNRLAALQGACTRADVCKDQKTLQNLVALVGKMASRNAELSFLQFKLENATRLVMDDKRKALDAKEEINRLFFGTANLSPEQEIERIRAEATWSEFAALERFITIPFLRLSDVPQELLTIILVMVGGALGRSALLLNNTIKGAGERLESIWLDPFFAAVVALVLFIVVKAGVLVATDPRAGGASATELNPFFVSFLGIVGGLISEQVVERVRTSAQQWLAAANADKPRWAVRVALEIEAQKKSLDDLIPFVAADKTQMERWVKGDIATPSEIQSTIAVWLGKPVREMFTDIAPLAKP